MGWLAPDHPALADVPPMPADFAPRLLYDHKSVRWRGTVDGGSAMEVGFALSDPQAEEKTRLAVWHVQRASPAAAATSCYAPPRSIATASARSQRRHAAAEAPFPPRPAV